MESPPSTPRLPDRIALLGDVQGYADRFEEALLGLGVDPSGGRVPAHLTVVQVGDLVHKGPDSHACLGLSERLLRSLHGRFELLVGNHEAQYLGGPEIWDELEAAQQDVIRGWAADGTIRVALGIDTVELGPTLVTHAGLTRQKWLAAGGPATPADAAAALNDEFRRDPVTAFTPGAMLDMDDQLAGVVWATAGEVLTSWSTEGGLPFSQVHGHTAPWLWGHGRWHRGFPEHLRHRGAVDEAARHTRFTWPDGNQIVGIDPGYGPEGAGTPLVPLVLTVSSTGARPG